VVPADFEAKEVLGEAFPLAAVDALVAAADVFAVDALVAAAALDGLVALDAAAGLAWFLAYFSFASAASLSFFSFAVSIFSRGALVSFEAVNLGALATVV
jgi:hypothetical protein